MQKNIDTLPQNFPMGPRNFPLPGGVPITPTKRHEAQRMAQPPYIPGASMFAPHRVDHMAGMHGMVPYNMMPYYHQGYMEAPYVPGNAVSSGMEKTSKQSRGVDPVSAIQVFLC